MAERRPSARQRLSLVRISSRARRRRAARPLFWQRGQRRIGLDLRAETLGNWAEGVARRYGWSLGTGTAEREPLVHRVNAAPARPVLRAHYHFAISQHWAPRLDLTLVSQAVGHWGEPTAGATERPVTIYRKGIPASSVAQGVAGRDHAFSPARMQLSAAAAATKVARAAATRSAVTPAASPPSEAVPSVIAPVAAFTVPALSPPLVLVRRPTPETPRVFHETPRPVATEQPAPPRDLSRLMETPQRPPGMPRFDEDPAVINRITESVMRQMDRRIQAYRERTGALR